MSTINDSDLLLVERNGNLHQITYDQMSTLNDDDILLVERGGVQYKVEAQYVSTGPNGVILPSVEVLTPLNGAGLNDGQSYTPISSAYVSTDSTPIYHRNFPERITTISGGSWVNENNLFDGTTGNASELTGASGVVSQVVFTPHAGWFEGETYIWAYAPGGGTIEILDDADTVLRTYTLLTSSGGNTAVGIVRVDQKIRFTTDNQNESLYIVNINRGPIDAEITGRVAFEFTDDTDLDKMVAPIIQTDENGNVKIPTTSTVDSTTTIPGVNKGMQLKFTGNGSAATYEGSNGSYALSPPLGARMFWGKADNTVTGAISDNVALDSGEWLQTSETADPVPGGPVLDEGESTYPVSGAFNHNGVSNYITEIGVTPGVLDIVSFTGNGSAIHEIPHNLGCKPGMVIIKRIEANGNWAVWHKDVTPGYHLQLNSDAYNIGGTFDVFPSEPTKDKFYVGNSFDIGVNGGQYVAYIFAADTAGKVKCGIYTGSSNSRSVPLGFKAGFFLTKCISNVYNWSATTLEMSKSYKRWHPNTTNAPYGSSSYFMSLDNATQVILQGGGMTDYNANNQQYVYLAIAEDLTGPNSTQLNLLSNQDLEYFSDGTEITSNLAASGSNISFASTQWPGSGNTRNISPQADSTNFFNISYAANNKWLVWIKSYSTANGHNLYDSERGLSFLSSQTKNPEIYNEVSFRGPVGTTAYQVSYSGYTNEQYSNYTSWNFLAAPQFFDVQKYVGDGSSSHAIQHDLGVEPGFIIVKSLSGSYDWACYHGSIPNDTFKLNSTAAATSPHTRITGATDSDFTLDSSILVNGGQQDYIAYLFAKDTPYVKCGSYTGASANTYVNTGFRPRWMMIKRTDSTGSWVILDKKSVNTYLKADTNDSSGNFSWYFDFDGVMLSDVWGSLNSDGAEYVYIAIADETEGHPPNAPSSSTVQGTPNVNAATMVVNAESFDVGDSASAPALEASITSVGGSEGNKIFVDASTGTWVPGLFAKGAETTVSAPAPDEITFTSQNQGTPTFSGVDATLASRTWTLESGPSATGPWTLVDTYVDYDVLNSQTGATPWTSNKPNLTPNTFYRVKVQYNSTNAESVESVYNTFKTGDA